MDVPEVTANIGRRVAELRARNGLTATELGDRLTELGVKWDRFTVANLETGRRQNITVTEMLALAFALGVAPVHLLVPLTGASAAVTPNKSFPIARVRAWVRGIQPLPGGDERIFRTEVPLEELGR